MSALRIRRGHRSRRRLDATSKRQPAPGTDQKRQNCARTKTKEDLGGAPGGGRRVGKTRRCADSELTTVHLEMIRRGCGTQATLNVDDLSQNGYGGGGGGGGGADGV